MGTTTSGRREEGSVDAAGLPDGSSEPHGGEPTDPVEVLIREARRRRRRWGGWIGGLMALALAAGVLAVAFGGAGGGRDTTPRIAKKGSQPPFGICAPCTPQSSASALARGHWVNLPPAPIATRGGEVAMWTGHLLVIWGGDSASTTYANGATCRRRGGGPWSPQPRRDQEKAQRRCGPATRWSSSRATVGTPSAGTRQ